MVIVGHGFIVDVFCLPLTGCQLLFFAPPLLPCHDLTTQGLIRLDCIPSPLPLGRLLGTAKSLCVRQSHGLRHKKNLHIIFWSLEQFFLCRRRGDRRIIHHFAGCVHVPRPAQ